MRYKNLSAISLRTALALLLMLLTSTTAWAAGFYYTDAKGIGWVCTIIESTHNVSIEIFNNGSLPATVNIPSSVNIGSTYYTVTSIGNGAFIDCSGLTSITIPSSVTSIGENAFSGCSGLTSITIPSSVTSIEEGTFYFCSGLTSITIPSSVTSIGGHAFRKCTSLASVIVYRAVPAAPAPTIGSCAFDNNAAVRKIYVPGSSKESFKVEWSAYEDDIVSQPEMAQYISITMNRDPGNTTEYWGTYYNSTNFSMQVPSGVTIYKAKVNDTKTKVVLTQIAGNTITLGQAVVLKCTDTGGNSTIT